MLAILGFIAVSNCSKIPENNDPVLGIWVKTALSEEITSSPTDASIDEEWIFNDVFLGRYHRYEGNEIVFYTDFKWEVIDGDYTITYSEDHMENVRVSLNQSTEQELLELRNGEVFAIRK